MNIEIPRLSTEDGEYTVKRPDDTLMSGIYDELPEVTA